MSTKPASPSKIHLPHLFQPSSTSLPVIDPVLKQFGRVWINMQFVEHTAAVRRWLSRDSHHPSLCLLHQQGHCSAGLKCNQAHVAPEHVAEVRRLLLAAPFSNCCFEHGDLASRRENFRVTVKRHPIELKLPEGVVPVPANCIAVTAFWDRFIKGDRKGASNPERVVRFPWQRICRLHQTGGCRYGVDCNNVHLCQHFLAERQLQLPKADAATVEAEVADEISSQGSSSEMHTPPLTPEATPRRPAPTTQPVPRFAGLHHAAQPWVPRGPATRPQPPHVPQAVVPKANAARRNTPPRPTRVPAPPTVAPAAVSETDMARLTEALRPILPALLSSSPNDVARVLQSLASTGVLPTPTEAASFNCGMAQTCRPVVEAPMESIWGMPAASQQWNGMASDDSFQSFDMGDFLPSDLLKDMDLMMSSMQVECQ